MAFRHTLVRVIPWSGCVPAEPASVSPGQVDVSQALAYRQEQASRPVEQHKGRGQEGRTGCSEETLVFCLDNGVHYTPSNRLSPDWPSAIARSQAAKHVFS